MRLDKLMRLRGAAFPDPLDVTEARDAALAAQRCLECRSSALCDDGLAGHGLEHRLFCPNSHYIEYLRSRSLKFA